MLFTKDICCANIRSNAPRALLYTATSIYPVLTFFYKCNLDRTAGNMIILSFYIIAICCCAAEDIITRTIPNFLSCTLFLSGIFFRIREGNIRNIITNLIVAAVIFVILIAVYCLTKKGIGGGDIKMIAASSTLLGFLSVLAAFTISVFCAAIFCLTILVKNGLQKKKRTQRTIPFGPFYAIGVLIQLYELLANSF